MVELLILAGICFSMIAAFAYEEIILCILLTLLMFFYWLYALERERNDLIIRLGWTTMKYLIVRLGIIYR